MSENYETYEREYKGHPMFVIVVGEFKGEKNEFSFGLKKAKAILDCVEDIAKFVELHEEGKPF